MLFGLSRAFRAEAKGHLHLLEVGSYAMAGQRLAPSGPVLTHVHLLSSSKLCKYSMTQGSI